MHVTRTDWRANPKPLPEGQLVTAIGDVHGCAGHLEEMYGALAEDVARIRPEATTCILLGDLIDRGPDSLDCLGLAVDGLAAFTRQRTVEDVVLLGNHEEWLLRAAEGRLTPEDSRVWAYNGGDATWRSLGLPHVVGAAALSAAIQDRLAEPVTSLLARMVLSHRVGDLLFVHAGIDPRRPLEDQPRESQLWIRDAFLHAKDWPFEVLVIHGHTIETQMGAPEVHPHRIGIDTGAFATGILTAVEFHGARMRFVMVEG